MRTDKNILENVEEGFEKNKKIMFDTMKRMDQVLTNYSNNVLCYLFIFIFIVLALLYKLSL